MKSIEASIKEQQNIPLRRFEDEKHLHNEFLIEENERLTYSLNRIRDYVKSHSDISSLHILEICTKTINNISNYKPLSE